MISIRNSPAFKTDYERYQKEIAQIEDDVVKNDLTRLLTDLLREVTALDMHHDAVMLAKKLPEGVQDSRGKIASIRKKIDAKLAPYKKQQV